MVALNQLASLPDKAPLYEAAHRYQRAHAAMQHVFNTLDSQVRQALIDDSENAPIPPLLQDAIVESGKAWDRFKHHYEIVFPDGRPYAWYEQWEHERHMKAVLRLANAL